MINNKLYKQNEFLNKAKNIHNNFYSYDKSIYVNARTKLVITCPIHGDFLQSPDCHINKKQGCKECKRYSRLDSRRLTTEKFIIKSNKVHDNLYDYSKSIVNGNKNKVIITCKLHGDFLQSPNSHMRGRGCKQCCIDNNGYGKNKFVHFAKKNDCLLYLIEVFNDAERFLKVGITSKDVATRFNGNKKLPYSYKVVKTFSSKSSSFIWDQEVLLKRKFKKHKYVPLIKFKGYTECFNLLEKENITKYIKQLNESVKHRY